jgi:hypothetical protein
VALDDARLELANDHDVAAPASAMLELAKIAVVVPVLALDMPSAVPAVIVIVSIAAVGPYRRGREDRGSEKSRDNALHGVSPVENSLPDY